MLSVKAEYSSCSISNNKHNLKFLFDTVAKLTKKSISCSAIMAHEFLDFFCTKVNENRYSSSSFPASPADPADPVRGLQWK